MTSPGIRYEHLLSCGHNLTAPCIGSAAYCSECRVVRDVAMVNKIEVTA